MDAEEGSRKWAAAHADQRDEGQGECPREVPRVPVGDSIDEQADLLGFEQAKILAGRW